MMKINMKIFLVWGGEIINETTEVELEEGALVADLFKNLDGSGKFPRRLFRSLLRPTRGVGILHNGVRLKMSGDRKKVLANGDDIAVFSAIAGG